MKKKQKISTSRFFAKPEISHFRPNLGPFGFKKPRRFFSNNLAPSLFKLEDTLGVRNQKFSKSSSGENLGTNVQTDRGYFMGHAFRRFKNRIISGNLDNEFRFKTVFSSNKNLLGNSVFIKLRA